MQPVIAEYPAPHSSSRRGSLSSMAPTWFHLTPPWLHSSSTWFRHPSSWKQPHSNQARQRCTNSVFPSLHAWSASRSLCWSGHLRAQSRMGTTSHLLSSTCPAAYWHHSQSWPSKCLLSVHRDVWIRTRRQYGQRALTCNCLRRTGLALSGL